MKNQNGEMTPIKTRDMYLAVYLEANDYHVGEIEGPPNRLLFNFENVPAELIDQFIIGNDPVRKTIDAYKRVKEIILRAQEQSGIA